MGWLLKTMHDIRNWLESRLDRIEEIQAEIKVTLAAQAKDIEHHIKRTDLLDDFSKKLAKQMVELMEHIHQVRGVAKFLGVLSLLAGLVATLVKLVR